MDWVQFAVFILGNMVFTLTLWLWNRNEANSDRRDMVSLLTAIHEEIKDFHGRLCTLEEKYRQVDKK